MSEKDKEKKEKPVIPLDEPLPTDPVEPPPPPPDEDDTGDPENPGGSK